MRALAALLCCLPLIAQDPAVADLVATLASAETLDGPEVGEDGGRSETWKTYERLRRTASAAQLLELTHHAAPVVRGYAVRALLETDAAVDWLAVLRAHARDTAEVTEFEGCIRSRGMTGDVFVNLVRTHAAMTDPQWLDLAETLVHDASPLYAREWCLRTLRFRDGMLHEIRALARDGDRPAVVALARYRIAKDLPILVEHLRRPDPFADNCQFLAAAIHADPQLLPALRDLVPAAKQLLVVDNAYRLMSWLQALAAQPGDEPVATLTAFLRDAPTTAVERADLAATFAELMAAHAAEPRFEALRRDVAKLRPAPSTSDK